MAITFGNTTEGSGTSYSHDNDGNFLIVGISSTSNDITAVTYDGEAMTQIGSAVQNTTSSRFITVWGKTNPSSGSNTVAVTGGANLIELSVSILGVDSDNAYTGTTSAGDTSSTPAIQVTTTEDNAYVVAFGLIRNFSNVGDNTTVLLAGADPNLAFYRSTNVVSPAGALTLNINSTGSEWDFIGTGFNPTPSTFDETQRTTQDYLNRKAGFTGELRTKQECLQSLSSRPAISTQDAANSYAGTTGKITQDAMNVKAGEGGATLTKQEAAQRF